QTSPVVQALPSSHVAVLLAWAHPVVGLQVSSVQALPSLQSSGAPATHAPSTQVSAPLQTLPSEHDVPSATWAFTQPSVGLQLSVVQTLPSSHDMAVPATQSPATQRSLPLHGLPSAHCGSAVHTG